jgi:hypothetical protein
MPELIVAKRLTETEREQLVERVVAANPRLRGAEVADILDIFADGDVMIDVTERFYEEHGDDLPGGERCDERPLAVIAAAILQPDDMRPLVERLCQADV